MQITSFNHKGLKALYAAGEAKNVKGVPAELVKKLHLQLSAIEAAPTIHSLASMAMWRVHELTPKFPGKWSLWVTGNYRLTFRLNGDGTVGEVDLEDYH